MRSNKLHKNLIFLVLFLVLSVLLCLPGCGKSIDESGLTSSLRISELMPSNESSIKNSDGERLGWVEIVNIGPDPINLEGCYLTNDSKDIQKWVFPNLELVSGERVVLFCSDGGNTSQDIQTNFALNKDGGELVLSTPHEIEIDAVSYGEAVKDASVSFLSSGNEKIEPLISYQATPGFPNTEEGYLDTLDALDSCGALIINEAVDYNRDYCCQYSSYYDWVELKNISSDTINLSDYYLSDDEDNLQMTQLPDKELKPGELFIVFCSGDSSLSTSKYSHADFAIGNKDHLFLTMDDGTVSDELYLHDLPLNGSIGRMDNEKGFFYFTSPSPMEDNSDGYHTISEKPTANVEQGIFSDSESFTVELQGKGTIYYTLDGSLPTETDFIYEDPITVDKTTILRAVCKEEGKLISGASTYSYILEDDDTLPVTSLVCDPTEMFGFEGIYSAARELDAKCDADVSFFDTNGDGFSAGCSVELHGANSRNTYSKKSFELKFSSRYGGDLNYALFQDGNVTQFHSLLLRGGSSTRMELVRDSFVSSLMYDVCPEVYPQDTRYTVVYINGEYYGIYAWREAYSEEYFQNHTGADKDDIEMARAPLNEETNEDPWGAYNTIIKTYIDKDEQYTALSELFDLPSVARWLALEAYFNNQDISGNIRYVKLSPDAKWQIVLYDLDYSCLTIYPDWYAPLSTWQLGDPICYHLLKFDNFKQLLLEECSKLCKNGFTTENIQNTYAALLKPLDDDTIQKDCTRWENNIQLWEIYTTDMQNNLCESRMVDWLRVLRSLTGATAEEMHEYFPNYY